MPDNPMSEQAEAVDRNIRSLLDAWTRRENLLEHITKPMDKDTTEQPQIDNVNHPPHYNDHPSGVECITIARHMPFNVGNVIKYLWRAGKKDHARELEDLQKARFYLEDEIELVEQRLGESSK